MTWNYRLIKTEEGYSVFEVYYDESGSIKGWTEKPILNFFCEKPDDVLYELDVLKNAFDQPALSMEELENSENT